MAGPVPAIHATLTKAIPRVVDARNKSGHDKPAMANE